MLTALTRLAPFVGISLFFAIGFGGRVWLHHRRYGQSGVILFQQAGLWARLRDASLLVLPAGLLGLTLRQALAPCSVSWGQLPSLANSASVAAGVALLAASLYFLVAAQLQMGKSWRIGIDERARPGLVTWGLYRYCRNPIFASMLLALLGVFLIMPSLLTLLILSVAYAGIRRQVADEEAYLRGAYTSQYAAYAARVGRFNPWIGRLQTVPRG